jgi:hypothetical protein
MKTDIEINTSGEVLATNIAYVDILARLIHPL